MNFSGKVFVITGASSGLGKELATQILSLGAKVALCSKSQDYFEDDNSLFQKVDVISKEQVADFIKSVQKKFGQIDIVIANAGKSMWSRFKDIDNPDKIKELMDINYMGVVNLLFYTLPFLKNGGTFVAISSIQGVIPCVFHSGYVASKHALNGFINTLRQEEEKVHFLLVMPAWIKGTDLRKNCLLGDLEGSIKVKSHEKEVISSKEVASLIIKAIKNGKEELFIPCKYRFLPFLRSVFPKLVDFIVKKKVNLQIL